MVDLAQIVADFLARAGVERDEPVIAACSGGPDSTALAHAAAGLLDELTLAHVDHGLRAGSERDADHVAALAARLGARCRALRVAVDRGRAALEGAARAARYAALDALADELGARWVLTGHTASDQAETVLMRILRGTGIAGLAGIPARRGRYLRPLLAVRHDDVLAYLAAHELHALEDPMNADLGLARNRVRRRWLPALRAENPAVDDALVRLARAAAEQRELLEHAADRVELTAAGIAAAPDGAAKRALARAATAAGADGLTARHLDDLLALMRRPDAGTLDLALPGVTARREYGQLRFVTDDGEHAEPVPEITVTGRHGPYSVRRWRPGDRMRPQRLHGRSRKLSDLFIDAKIPRRQRARARVAVRERDGAIVWAEHIGPAYGAMIDVTLTRPRGVATNKK